MRVQSLAAASPQAMMTLSIVKFLITLCLADGPVNNKPSATFWYFMLYIPYTGFLNFLHVRRDLLPLPRGNMPRVDAHSDLGCHSSYDDAVPGCSHAVAACSTFWPACSMLLPMALNLTGMICTASSHCGLGYAGRLPIFVYSPALLRCVTQIRRGCETQVVAHGKEFFSVDEWVVTTREKAGDKDGKDAALLEEDDGQYSDVEAGDHPPRVQPPLFHRSRVEN